jgi:glycosyltransferase involved in cell wall biosynthesis
MPRSNVRKNFIAAAGWRHQATLWNGGTIAVGGWPNRHDSPLHFQWRALSGPAIGLARAADLQNWKLIASDDGSSDETKSILQSFGKSFAPGKVRIIDVPFLNIKEAIGASVNSENPKQWRIENAHHLKGARFQLRRIRAGARTGITTTARPVEPSSPSSLAPARCSAPPSRRSGGARARCRRVGSWSKLALVCYVSSSRRRVVPEFSLLPYRRNVPT